MSGGVAAGRDERGAASLYAVVAAGLLVVLGLGAAVVASAVVGLRTAQAAADLAALAGAVAAGRGDDPCAAAARVARANGADLAGCAAGGAGGADVREVRVVVEVRGPHWLGLDADPRAEARAGPVAGAVGGSGPG